MWSKKNIAFFSVAATAALVAFVFFLIGWRNANQASEPEINIGIILPLGTTLEEGTAMEQAIRFAAEEWNARGGVQGKPVQIIARDGDCDRGRARLAVEELVLKLRVPYLIGGLCDAEAEGAAEGAGEKAIIIAPTAKSGALAQKDDNIFLLTPPRGEEMPVLAKYLVRTLKKTDAAVLFQDSERSRFSAAAFEKSMADAGGRVGSKASFYPRTVAPEDAAKSVSGGDILFLISEIPAYTERLIAAVRQKYPDMEIYVPATTLEHALDRPLFQGIKAIRPKMDGGEASLRDFEKRYESRYAEAPAFPYEQAAAYDALNLFLRAINAKGYENQDKVRDAIASVRRYDGASGSITFDDFGNFTRPYEIIEYKDNTLQSVAVFEL